MSSSLLGTRKFFCIEYPGYVENTEKAIDSMGGMERINKVVNEQIKYIDVNYRKNDSFSHPLYADYVPTSNRVIIKLIRKKKRKRAQDREKEEESTREKGAEGKGNEKEREREEEEDKEGEVRAEILGPVTHSMQFAGLSDFQLQTKFSAAAREEDIDELELAPLIFSRFDYVRDYRFMNHIPNIRDLRRGQEQQLLRGSDGGGSSSSSGTKSKGGKKTVAVAVGSDEESEVETFVKSTRKKRQTFLEYSAPVPTGPLPGSYFASKNAKKHPITQKIRAKFSVRPIWSKANIRLALSDENALVIARHLAVVGYRFSGGPWRNLWIRYGYDPRTDASARIYQSIDFRMPHEKLALLGVQIPDRREKPIRKRLPATIAAATVTTTNTDEENVIVKRKANEEKKAEDKKKDTTVEKEDDGNISEKDEDDISEKDEDDEVQAPDEDEDEEGGGGEEDDLHFSRLPMKPSTMYQLLDLEGDEIQKLLRSCPPTAQCTKEFGWYPKTVMIKVRALMKAKVDQWIEAFLATQHDLHEATTEQS